MDVINELKSAISSNPVLLFMKGTPDFPQCGFSQRTVQALQSCEAEFAYVDVLANPGVRENLPKISQWPTFPQVFINGELVGGCDITLDLYQKGELKEMVRKALESQAAT